MLERIAISVVMAAVGIAVYLGATRWQLWRARVKRLGLEALRPGTPAILYFSAPTCIPCRTLQRPAIDRLLERYHQRLQVIEVNAAERADLADYWGVLSTPTTFIIDDHGEPRRVNHGVATMEKLRRQIEEVCPGIDARAGREVARAVESPG